MSDDDAAAPGTGGERSGGAAEEPLADALDDLERILETHRTARSPADPDEGHGEADDGQYEIPLLSDVIVPGAAPGAAAGTGAHAPHPGPEEGPLSDAETCRRIVQRLASEIDVIVQSRIEAALKEASRDIRAELRRHIDIVLPEILDEISPPEPDDD